MAAKTFPPKVQIGEGCVGGYESDIDAFVANPMEYRA
jgi:predicted DNA-binding transcriptional regulator AlpA